MITLITIPCLPKLETNDLLKCLFFSVGIDLIILLACIHL